tara:strand:- start:2479 stop:3102 length:624 start_codon:yes stop_codon:yes gene_type:complete
MDMTTRKERSDMILEPLQVMIQLALVSKCPIGTKVSVYENILHIQEPYLTQGIVRWWNKDNKDDLYYLFHAIRRYYKWYKVKDNKIFASILDMAIEGINKLIETYDKCDDKQSIVHTLSLYKNVLKLDTPDLFKDSSNNEVINIDNVFKNITNLYDKKLLRIVANTLALYDIDENNINRKCYLDGLNKILTPLNNKIKKWIHENLTC